MTVGIESLTEDEKRIAEQYRKTAAPNSILVGLIRTDNPENPRVLVLEKGEMSLLRFSDPVLNLNPEKVSLLYAVLQRAQKKSSLTGITAVGKTNVLWARRSHLPSVMTESDLTGLSEADAIRLVRAIGELHRSGVVHGHLSPSNLSKTVPWIVLDPGFSGFGSGLESEYLAPEREVSVQGDIYSLGVILSKAKSIFKEKDKQFCIERMLRADPAERPTLEEVLESLAGEKASFAPVKITDPKSKMPFLYIVLGLLILGGIWFGKDFVLSSYESEFDEETDYVGMLKSGQPSLIAEVAKAAQKSSRAQQAIYKVIMEGFQHPKVNSNLVKLGFNEQWEAQLSKDDRAAIISLAFLPLLPSDALTVPKASSLHPSVVFSVLGSLDVESEGGHFLEVPPARLGSLPEPYGSAFASLSGLGVSSMEQGAARALVHILLGNVEPKVFSVFFDGYADLTTSLVRLRFLLPFLDQKAIDVVWGELQMHATPVAGWFFISDLAGWSKVTPKSKLGIMAGLFPENIRLEQAIDLLQFPLSAVAEESLNFLLKRATNDLTKKSFQILPKLDLTREQSISLGNLLFLDSGQAAPFVKAWLETKPKPESALALLLARDVSGKDDSLTLALGQYLVRNEFSAGLKEYAKMITHPDPFIRTLGYLRLNPEDQKERSMLERVLPLEDDPKNKELIKERLKK